MCRSSATQPASRPSTSPIRNEPLRFAINVPTGKSVPYRLADHTEIA